MIERVKEKSKKDIETMEVSVGEYIPLSQHLPKKYSDKSVNWISSDTTISIKNDTAFCSRPGRSVISFMVDGKKPKQIEQLEVCVTEALYSINKDSSSLFVGQCDTLFVTPSVINARWRSSNPQIASVDHNGIVRAKNMGDCTISCRIEKSTLECQIHVERGSETNEATTDSSDVKDQLAIEI